MSTLTGSGRGGGTLESKPLWTPVLPMLFWWDAAREDLQPYVGTPLTFSRSGAAMRVNAGGVLEEVPANEPRWNYMEESP